MDERNKRDIAAEKIRAWWDAGMLAGEIRKVADAPAWPEYLATFEQEKGDDSK